MDFSTTLLREKFTLRDARSEEPPLIALSNRVSFSLKDSRGRVIESFVVRSQMMHTCLRMAAKIVHTYTRVGPLMARDEKFDLAAAWSDITRDYERVFNPSGWVSVYNEGKKIFSSGDYHAFLDIIENCEKHNRSGNYDTSVFLAEEIFAKNGKAISIDHDANTGMVLDIKNNHARCGLVLRSPVRRTNFNYMAGKKPTAESPLSTAQCITIAAAFLEGIQLAFYIGRINEQLRLEEISRYGEGDRQATAARGQLAHLNAEIKSFENNFYVTYRPERPEFPALVIEAEKYTHQLWEKKQAELEDQLSESE